LGGDKLISQTRSGTTNYYLQDGQGSTRALTNGSGTVTDTYSFTAFGELFNQTGTTTNSYLYTGQQFDSLTGLYDLRARYYNPALGRFLSQDTYPVDLSNPIEINRYAYTANNPINAIDPSGNLFIENIGINANTSQNTGRVAAVGAYTTGLYMRVIIPLILVSVPTALLIGELIGIDELVKDLPDLDIKSLERILAEQQWKEWIRLRPNPNPSPEPDKEPKPEPTYPPPPPIFPTPENDCDAPPWTDWVAPYPITGDAAGEIHHIATNKHGSYWTAIFRPMFVKANLSLDNSSWNLITLAGHRGRHLDDYHRYVFDELQTATVGLKCNPYRHALQRELWSLKKELMTPNSYIRRLLGLQP